MEEERERAREREREVMGEDLFTKTNRPIYLAGPVAPAVHLVPLPAEGLFWSTEMKRLECGALRQDATNVFKDCGHDLVLHVPHATSAASHARVEEQVRQVNGGFVSHQVIAQGGVDMTIKVALIFATLKYIMIK